MKTKKILKNQKPISTDIHLRYLCPNIDCRSDHWLNIKECRIKNFKVVCECGTVFAPKQITSFKLQYIKKIKQQSVYETQEISVDTLEKCVKLLNTYGFTESESVCLVKNAYNKSANKDEVSLIKFILQNLEDNNVG